MPCRTGPLRRAALAAVMLAALDPVAAAQRLPPGASSCGGCHAPRATEPGDPPALTGLSADDIATALADYRTGKRAGTIMPRIAAGVSQAEARAIADALGRPEKTTP